MNRSLEAALGRRPIALIVTALSMACSAHLTEPTAAAPEDFSKQTPCATERKPHAAEGGPQGPTDSPQGPPPAPAGASEPGHAAESTQPPRLPPGLLPGVWTELPVPGDRAVRVIHAGPTVRRALIYLHGMCGNPEAMNDWAPMASQYGTMVVLRADVPCGDRPGNKWPTDIASIQQRIDRALAAVSEQRGGLLDDRELVLIGYSQGAHRGERLAEAYPARYPYLVLGGPPGAASPERLAAARGVAILGGDREDTTHMEAGDAALRAAGIRSRFFVLTGVGHGSYGPDASKILNEVFDWLLN